MPKPKKPRRPRKRTNSSVRPEFSPSDMKIIDFACGIVNEPFNLFVKRATIFFANAIINEEARKLADQTQPEENTGTDEADGEHRSEAPKDTSDK